MNTLEQLKSTYGSRCTAIRVNPVKKYEQLPEDKQVRFCEAVSQSFKDTFMIGKEDVCCRGARRTIWPELDNDVDFSGYIATNAGIDRDFVRESLKHIPEFQFQVHQIALGNPESPDLYVLFAKPAQVTQLMFDAAKFLQQRLETAPYFFLSVCSNVFTQVYHSSKPFISFGCPDSRYFGGIQEDEVVIGLPAATAERLMEKSQSYSASI